MLGQIQIFAHFTNGAESIYTFIGHDNLILTRLNGNNNNWFGFLP
jgi:hypothetical protein